MLHKVPLLAIFEGHRRPLYSYSKPLNQTPDLTVVVFCCFVFQLSKPFIRPRSNKQRQPSFRRFSEDSPRLGAERSDATAAGGENGDQKAAAAGGGGLAAESFC